MSQAAPVGNGPGLSVLHVLPRCAGGGAERSVLAAIDQARSTGSLHRHTIVVLDGGVAPPLLFTARRCGATILVRPERAVLDGAWRDHDVVVIHWWNHPALASLLARDDLPAARVMLWAHALGLHPPQVLAGSVARFADLVVATSSLTLTSAELARLAATSRRTIPGIADMSRLDGFVARPHDGICIGYVGVVNEMKMHPRFAELSAAVRGPGIRFEVFGGGGGEDELRRRVGMLGANDRISVIGHVDDVAAALGGIDVFGYPLRADSYATSEKALQEAMWVGIPPVVLSHGGAAELVHHEVTGLVARSDDDYVGMLERLASDGQLRDRLGAEARARVRRTHDPRRLTALWLAAIDDTASLPRRTRPAALSSTSPAHLFADSLGEHGRAFHASLAGRPRADDAVAAAPELVARCEGGVNHFRNTYPHDPHLTRWASLLASPVGQ